MNFSWPILVLPFTAQMQPIPTTEQGGYDVISAYVINKQRNVSCVGDTVPATVARLDIGCNGVRTDCAIILPFACQPSTMNIDDAAITVRLSYNIIFNFQCSLDVLINIVAGKVLKTTCYK